MFISFSAKKKTGEEKKKKTYIEAFFFPPMSIFDNDRTTHLPSRALINCMYAQYLYQ